MVASFVLRAAAFFPRIAQDGRVYYYAAKPEGVAKLVPQPGMSPVEQARLAFSAACGKAFLASADGQAFIESQLVEQSQYPTTPMHTYQRQMEAIMSFDTFARLGEIKSRTLVIQGDDDAIVTIMLRDDDAAE